ncbi:MAG: UDP-N-acetylglucosamine--N-acetylmuramyl-(pentapeptide) pyrophosphoryl-undecaprenol N-acetylglucosamine transferase [Methanosphaera stadtmanae]|nr:UDP-N-acetylglucosamine--N-acetylmuramyl-(pentapeptide) pyrophosphoryl-undecaprenol N-acetylglucosamine transferase [Methanosphaera stadtmanae]
MKILITTCGVGIGHSSRDLALANYLKKYGHNIEFASYGSGLKYLQKYNFKTYSLPKMNFEGHDGEINIEESIKQSKDIPFTFIKSMYKESRIIKKSKPNVIICDSHYSMPIIAKFLNIPCYIITNDLTFGFSKSTQMKSIKYFEKSIRRFIIEITKSCKKIMIPDIPGVIEIPEELKNKTEFIGPLLHYNANELGTKHEIRQKYNINDEDKILVVTIGGSEFGKIMIKNICDISKSIEADKIIIFTGLEVETSSFDDYDSKVIIYEFTHNLVEWMKLSDLTITLAGHTTSMELLSIKQPNIMMPILNHIEQERNSKRMEKTGITQVVEINNTEKLLEIINDSLKNINTIKINDELYSKFLLYDGKKNALNTIQNNIKQIKQI